MRRVGSVILFLAIVSVVFYGIFFSRQFLKQNRQIKKDPAETYSIKVYTDNSAALLRAVGEVYEDQTHVHLDVTEIPVSQLADRMASPDEKADIVFSSQNTLQSLQQKHMLQSCRSQVTEAAAAGFEADDGSWVGIWLDPVVFAVNQDFARTRMNFSYDWDDVLSDQSVRISMTDFTASDMAADFFFSLTEYYGTDGAFQRLRNAGTHTVQYGKTLSAPALLAAMGKCDIGISSANEARRAKLKDMPIDIIYPVSGTAYYLYGAGIGIHSAHRAQAQAFIDWMLSSEKYRKVLADHEYYLDYVGDTDHRHDIHGNTLLYWNLRKQFSEEGKKLLMDQWLQEIRFRKD